MLTAAAPSFGAPATAGDGWRARGTTARSVRVAKPTPPAIRQVAYEDDIAGPSLRTAGRMPHHSFYDGEYRVAQQNADDAFGDSLKESFERPFGVEETGRPADGGRFDPAADEADRLFDDMPAEEPAPAEPEPAYEEPVFDEPAYESDEATQRRAGSLFDDEPRTTAEEIGAGVPANAEPDATTRNEGTGRFSQDRGEAMQSCSEGLAELKASRLASIDLSIRVTGSEGEDFPYVCSLDDGSVFAPRQWCDVTYMWKASGLCHKPLYFEDVHLERYGHSWGPFVQPLVSGAHFFGSIPVLPYKMGLQAPNECVYTLGYYRPGDCAPYLLDPIPFTWRAALFQAGATVGVAAILP
ncbi:hypothetical protein Pla108_26500 [Botrimarina colliarenosi]|uniref:Uncharacterized protein n=2 Tax=Botrimarina colliarenosi TaxID=2528001 RepID=A0A5C6ACJ7_9BACT|nr:hypothetical protein Pla108_26500 [Botrimarina colliarenosi]